MVIPKVKFVYDAICVSEYFHYIMVKTISYWNLVKYNDGVAAAELHQRGSEAEPPAGVIRQLAGGPGGESLTGKYSDWEG